MAASRCLRCPAVLLVLLTLACTPREDPDAAPAEPPDPGLIETPETLSDSLDALREQIRAEVGNAAATDLESCRALPFGAKPCGGPWTYLVFSTEVSDAEALEDMVARYNAMEDRLNREEGRISDCAYVSRPTLALEGRRCVAAPNR